MLVLVCGMHRSGSTLVWQITRQLLDGRPGLRNPRGIPTSEFPVAAADPHDLLLAKAHYRSVVPASDFPDEGALYIYTYRDVRDVVASLFRKGAMSAPRRGGDESRAIARRELRGDSFWRQRRVVWIGRYEHFRDDVPGLVRSLADFLGVSVTPERVAEIVDWVSIDRQRERVIRYRDEGIDPDTRITEQHITDGREGAWRDTLTIAELEAVEQAGARWLVRHGYDVDTELGHRLTADLREPRWVRSARKVGAAPLLGGACAFAVVGAIATFTLPATAIVPWALAVGCGITGAHLRGSEHRPLVHRRSL